MNMEYDFVPAPTDAKEFEQWRKEQAKIIQINNNGCGCGC